MIRFRIIIWKWEEQLAKLDVDFETLEEASIYAMGIFNGMNLNGAQATGYEYKEQ